MAPRPTGPADDIEFDLAGLLWGDLPLVASPPGAAPDEPAAASRASLGAANGPAPPRHSVTAPPRSERASPLLSRDADPPAVALARREPSTPWDVPSPGGQEATASTSADVAADAIGRDDVLVDLAFDLDALAAMADLADAVGNDDLDPARFDSGDEIEDPPFEERMLSYGELSERLRREVVPRLRALAVGKGYLSLGHLARAIVDLQGSDRHLAAVRAVAERANVPILPSRSHQIGRALPLWAIEQARQRFGDLLRDQIDQRVVVERFGYADVPLSHGTRAFLVQAWMNHCLSRAEERTLTETIATEVARVGEEFTEWSTEALAAREALILDNLWLVARMSRGYLGRGVEIDDLIQAGSLSLFRAVAKFDPDLNYRFATYASSWVFQSITRYIGDNSRLIRLPVHAHDRGKAIAEATAHLRQAHEREPTLAEIAEASDTPEPIVSAHLVTTRPILLDDPRHRLRIGSIASATDDPVAAAETSFVADAIRDVLATLPGRERAVLELRFGLLDGEEQTLEEISRVFGVTRERIRQIEDKALLKLRHPSLAKRLEIYAADQSKPVLQVSTAAAKKLLPEFSLADQEIIQWIWGLLGRRQQSVQATAKRLRVSAERVREVCVRVAALHCDRGSARATRAMAGHEHAPVASAAGTVQPTQDQAVDPSWMLDAADTDSAAWAARHVAEQLPLSPPEVTQLALPSDHAAAEPAAAAFGSLHDRIGQRETAASRPGARSDLEQRGPGRPALTDASRQAISDVAQGILDRDLRAVAEARAGLHGRSARSQDEVMFAMGVTRAYVKRAEQSLLDGLVEDGLRQALRQYWRDIEPRDQIGMGLEQPENTSPATSSLVGRPWERAQQAGPHAAH